MIPRGTCQFCGSTVWNGDIAAFRVTGWEFERAPGNQPSPGGANQVVGREREPNVIFHVECVRQHLRNPDGIQMSLDAP